MNKFDLFIYFHNILFSIIIIIIIIIKMHIDIFSKSYA